MFFVSAEHARGPLFTQTLPGGWNWSHILKRGTSLEIRALESNVNAAMMLYAAWNFSERFNMGDTLKAQHISYYTKGNVLYSDMGRILLSITEDSLGRHDAIGGMSNPRLVREKYGKRSYQDHHNEYSRDTCSAFIAELAKYGMTKSSLITNINFFSRVDVARDGSMSFVPDYSHAGDRVELRAEMDTLIILNTCPHPMDPRGDYDPGAVELSVRKSEAPAPDDPCRMSCEENIRGFMNTEIWHL